jgi:hypothetical protein
MAGAIISLGLPSIYLGTRLPGDRKWEFIMGTKPAVADPFEESMADCNFFNCDFRHTKVTFES